MNEPDDVTRAVLTSLREQPTLNTPTLIAGGPHIPEGTNGSAVEAALAELVASGHVRRRPTGWKLAPAAG